MKKNINWKKDTDWKLFFQLLVFIIMGAIWGFLLCRIVDAQEWNWSPPASHHAAVYSVYALAERDQEGREGWNRGSGVLVKYDELTGILTAAHIMTGKRIIVTDSKGGKSHVESKGYTIDKFGHDLAFIFAITDGSIKPIEIAGQDPNVGDYVEFMTVGGPQHRLRSFWSTVKSIASDTTEYNGDVLAGDSGGGILDISGMLVGIQSYGIPPRIAGQANWPAYHGSGSASYRPVRDFLRRVAKKCELEGNCPPPGEQPSPRGSQFYPQPQRPGNKAGQAWRAVIPGKPAAVAEPERKQPTPRQPEPSHKVRLSPPAIDYEKLAEVILSKIDLRRLRGPVGPQGKPGVPGQQGPIGPEALQDINAIADAVKKKISGSIRIRVSPITK